MLKPDHMGLPGPMDLEAEFDYQEAVAGVDGDSELLAEMACLFVESYAEQVSAIGTGVARGDCKVVERTAHALKGAIANFSSRGAFERARILEEMGRRGDLTDAAQVFTELKESLGCLIHTLSELYTGASAGCSMIRS